MMNGFKIRMTTILTYARSVGGFSAEVLNEFHVIYDEIPGST